MSLLGSPTFRVLCMPSRNIHYRNGARTDGFTSEVGISKLTERAGSLFSRAELEISQICKYVFGA